MKQLLKVIFALHASLAYLGMLTGFGMLVFTFSFIYLITQGSELTFFKYLLTYLMFILGPGALTLAAYFYNRMQRAI